MATNNNNKVVITLKLVVNLMSKAHIPLLNKLT